jgi:hypothetical protein
VVNPSNASGTPKQQGGPKHPLEAALGVKFLYVAMLHESLIKFLDDLAEKSIRLFSDYFYKNKKYQANLSNPTYLPKPIKHIGHVTLQSKDEVTECKDFKALQLKLSADLEKTRRRITIKYILPADNLHCLALKRFFQLSICRLLASAALGFIAETDIKNYNEHDVVMDILATSPSSLLINPIAQSYREFALLYKEAHKLKFVSPPATKNKVLTDVLNEINGNKTRQTKIVEDATIKTPTDITTFEYNNSTFSAITAPTADEQQPPPVQPPPVQPNTPTPAFTHNRHPNNLNQSLQMSHSNLPTHPSALPPRPPTANPKPDVAQQTLNSPTQLTTSPLPQPFASPPPQPTTSIMTLILL